VLIVINSYQRKSQQTWKERFYFVNWQLTYIECLSVCLTSPGLTIAILIIIH